jgi:hypothetical protein
VTIASQTGSDNRGAVGRLSPGFVLAAWSTCDAIATPPCRLTYLADAVQVMMATIAAVAATLGGTLAGAQISAATKPKEV